MGSELGLEFHPSQGAQQARGQRAESDAEISAPCQTLLLSPCPEVSSTQAPWELEGVWAQQEGTLGSGEGLSWAESWAQWHRAHTAWLLIPHGEKEGRKVQPVRDSAAGDTCVTLMPATRSEYRKGAVGRAQVKPDLLLTTGKSDRHSQSCRIKKQQYKKAI